jgi:hypothetical protein
VSCELGASSLHNLMGEGWIDYDIPSILDVGMQPLHTCEFFDVRMEIVDHSGNWKSGMILDFVELIRVRGDDQGVNRREASSIVTVFRDWVISR